MIYLLSILGAVLYRMRGGWPDIARPIEQLLFCAPIGYIAYNNVHWALAIVIYALSVGACLKGHGHTMSLKAPVNTDKLEDYEFFTKWLIGRIPDYWYKVLAHGFGGLLMTLPLVFIDPIAAFSGLLKAPAYMTGWVLHPEGENGRVKANIGKFTVNNATEWGEFLTGLFIWAALMGAGW